MKSDRRKHLEINDLDFYNANTERVEVRIVDTNGYNVVSGCKAEYILIRRGS